MYSARVTHHVAGGLGGGWGRAELSEGQL